MGGVRFLSTHRDRGEVAWTGPVTGAEYIINPHGTPVSEYDYLDMLGEFAEPCCGKEMPFGGKLRLFYPHTATIRQMAEVPDWLYSLEPKEYDFQEEMQAEAAAMYEEVVEQQGAEQLPLLMEVEQEDRRHKRGRKSENEEVI
ncbi:MAG: hypothetical protein M0R06_18915 [Sphaerochaeta sp.]|jgi:hypothetical protein|nr:hypothetical protein [Sphaerochaeta sp.]